MATKENVVIFPFMAKGHTIPLLHLAAFLSSHHGHFAINLITTPGNASFFHRHLPSHKHPNISILSLPFPSFPPLPPGIESTDTLPSASLFPTFLNATTLFHSPFRQLLSNLSPLPICIISDFFLGWTLPVANEFNIPRIVFHGMSVFSMAMNKSLKYNMPKDDQPFTVPGTPPSLLLTRDDIPDAITKFSKVDDPEIKFYLNHVFAMDGVGDTDCSSQGILVNSFIELEQEYVKLFESFYRKGARAWLVGPLCTLAGNLLNEEISDEEGCLTWLDEREKNHNSVLYVSFGTQTHVSHEQLDEVAHGLIASGYPFIWVVRSKTWTPPQSLVPDISTRGKIVRGWVPQKQVLEHAATGAFLSHCGWNSVLESISCGVPILCWPMISEQPLNGKHVVDILGAGVRIGAKRDEIVSREAVENGVKRVMEDDKVRENTAMLQRAAGKAVAEGGSSQVELSQLFDELSCSGRCARDNKRKCVDSCSEGGFEECVSERASLMTI
ncbi:Glycosyltransferase [Rhynchospora pubera]|uniref:Glycosyltransferase n=1 Tax=Rhynchospora pubera TaxID=906938 RepID=A0AAV8HLH3_9POAL|nr:Glycosyltransferase [Rhynchospora pubera]